MIDANNEIIVDNFACAGGASTGIEAAIGRPVDHAINHNAKALAVHMANHPHTKHWREDIRNLDPRRVGPGQPVGLAWFSPDCTYFSPARGGKPFRDPRRAYRVRGLPGSVHWWIRTRRPRVICLENVREFSDWGPLLENGKPCSVRRGQSFRRWHRIIENMGYRVDMRELRASDYGVPTLRKRLFVVARCDGEEIVFPEATHGPGLNPYTTAADCIDWSDLGKSIFERSKPLVAATERRIFRGLMRHVINNPRPFIVGIDNKSNGGRDVWPLSDPLRTITTENRFALVTPVVMTMRGTDDAHIASSTRDLREPLRTVSAGGQHHALVTAFIARHYGGHENDGQDLLKPLHTITTKDHHALVTAFLLKYYGTEQDPQLRAPLHTITTKDRFALVTVHGGPHRGEYYLADIRMRMFKPRELARATSFRDDYILNPEFDGKPLSQADQVWMIGNAVPPDLAEALVRANVVEQRRERAA